MVRPSSELRKMTDRELYKLIGGYKPGTPDHVAGMDELARRQRQPIMRISGWMLAVGAISLLVSVAIALRVFGLV